MGKFAQKPRPPLGAPKERGAVLKQTTVAPVAKPSALLKKTAFKAKSTANTKPKVPKYAVPKTRQPASDPDPSTIKFSVDAPAVVAPAPDRTAKPAEAATTAPRHIPKREKIQNRHDKLMRKFDTALEARRTVQMKAKAAKRTKRAQKQTIAQLSATKAQGVRSAIADMSSLSGALPTIDDALPSLQSLFQLKAGANNALRTGVPKFDKAAARKAAATAAKLRREEGDGGVKRKVSKTTNTLNKKQQFMQRYNHFQLLANDRVFKANPREVIAAHIRNRQKAEELSGETV